MCQIIQSCIGELWSSTIDSKVAGYPRHWKTLELVSYNYWWPQMSCYIRTYTSTCNMCLRTKPSHYAPIGKLHPLPIPNNRCSMVIVDFISELLDAYGYNAIIITMDSVMRRAHFIPTTDHMLCSGCCSTLYLEAPWPLGCLCVRLRSLFCCRFH